MTLSTDARLSKLLEHRLPSWRNTRQRRTGTAISMEHAICHRNQRIVDKVQPNEDEIPTVFVQEVDRF
jgi:hypothetical protein